ncbi:hypothetical protein GGI35DRAFT_257037 [Trichoderma velutinum]
MPQSGLANSASLHQGEANRVPGLTLVSRLGMAGWRASPPRRSLFHDDLEEGKHIIYEYLWKRRNNYFFVFASCFVGFKRIEASVLRSLLLDIVDDSLMSEGGDERRGGGDDFLVREWMFTSALDGEENEHADENVSEASTLLPTSRGPSSLTAQPWPRHCEDGGEQRQEQEQQQNSSRRRGNILSCEGLLRIGLFVAMLVMVGLAVVRALKGKFSPGLVAGGGLAMVMCILVNKRELRGRLISD